MPLPPASSDLEARAQALLAQLTTAEKLGLLDGDTPFWAGMVDIALHDASHRHLWPAGQLPRLGLTGLHFVDGPRGVVLEGGATTFPVPMARGARGHVGMAYSRSAPPRGMAPGQCPLPVATPAPASRTLNEQANRI